MSQPEERWIQSPAFLSGRRWESPTRKMEKRSVKEDLGNAIHDVAQAYVGQNLTKLHVLCQIPRGPI